MLSCKQASQLISQSLDRRISLRERISLRLHLVVCDFCRRFSHQLRQVLSAVKVQRQQIEQDEHIRLPDEAKKRIASAIESGRA